MGPLKSMRVWPVIPTFMLLVLMASAATLASEEGGTAYLEAGDTVVIEIDNTAGDNLWIEYEVQVVEGPPVNVWFTDQEGLDQFFALELGTFSYYPSHSQKGTTLAEESFSWDEADVFYVIIDNWKNDASGQNATVDYTVTWEVYDFDELLFVLMIALIVIIIIVVVVLVVFINVRKAQTQADVRQAEAAREASTAWDDDDDDRPKPPEPYPEWVVRASSPSSLEEDHATGWDPSRDEPED